MQLNDLMWRSLSSKFNVFACCFMVHDMGEGCRGGRHKETVSWKGWYQVTKTAQYWSWPPSRRTPSTSRKC